MAEEQEQPIRLEYAGPTRHAVHGATNPGKQAAIPLSQCALAAPVAVLEDAARSDIAFAARALLAAGIAAVISEVAVVPGDRRRPQILLVEAADRERATTIVRKTLTRRTRLAGIPKQNDDGLKTRSQGGIWPDD